MVKPGLLSPKLKGSAMQKVGRERTLFHDLLNNCPGKSGNPKPQGSLHVLPPKKLSPKVAG